jgi:hypothetical protein
MRLPARLEVIPERDGIDLIELGVFPDEAEKMPRQDGLNEGMR